MVTKDADGTWNEDLCTSSYVGYGGVSETTEWNRKTPRGQFSFTYAFGILPNPGTELSYTQVDDTYYWVDDVNSDTTISSSRRRQRRKPGISRRMHFCSGRPDDHDSEKCSAGLPDYY